MNTDNQNQGIVNDEGFYECKPYDDLIVILDAKNKKYLKHDLGEKFRIFYYEFEEYDINKIMNITSVRAFLETEEGEVIGYIRAYIMESIDPMAKFDLETFYYSCDEIDRYLSGFAKKIIADENKMMDMYEEGRVPEPMIHAVQEYFLDGALLYFDNIEIKEEFRGNEYGTTFLIQTVKEIANNYHSIAYISVDFTPRHYKIGTLYFTSQNEVDTFLREKKRVTSFWRHIKPAQYLKSYDEYYYWDFEISMTDWVLETK